MVRLIPAAFMALFVTAFSLAMFHAGRYSPLVPAPSPPPPRGSVYLLDCEGKRLGLGEFLGPPEISSGFTSWRTPAGARLTSRGFVLFEAK